MYLVFEVRLEPKDEHSPVRFLDVRIDSHVVVTSDQCLTWLEQHFPDYDAVFVLEGVRKENHMTAWPVETPDVPTA